MRIAQHYRGEDVDLLIALHARRSAAAVRAFRALHPKRPLVLALTGTDLYGDLARSRSARRSVALADRIVVLHGAARPGLEAGARRKVRVIHQSVTLPARAQRSPGAGFPVCVLAHLRRVKDPLRAAYAVRRLPAHSRLHVVHLGRVLDPRMAARARAEERRNPRYRWLGERSHAAALRKLAGSRLLVLSSRTEGGANAIGEAARLGVGILASRVEGNLGLLGARHPGLFAVADTGGLRELLLRAESEPAFEARLVRASRRIAPLFRPARERRAWRALLWELGVPGARRVRRTA